MTTLPVIPSTKPKPFCFVLMPFCKEFDDVYQLGIKESCNQAGAYCERVDEQSYHGTIHERIYNQISKADFIIADMTGRNLNVFYEVGYAHALGKPTVLLTKHSEDIPFDLKNYPHIVYEGSITTLLKELTEKVKWQVANPSGGASGGKIDIELYYKDKNLSSDDVVCILRKGVDFEYNIVIHNASVNTYTAESLMIGISVPKTFNNIRAHQFHKMELPDGNYLLTRTVFDTLFPGAYTSLSFVVEQMATPVKEAIITFRVFAKEGSRDYHLIFRAN